MFSVGTVVELFPTTLAIIAMASSAAPRAVVMVRRVFALWMFPTPCDIREENAARNVLSCAAMAVWDSFVRMAESSAMPAVAVWAK